MSSIELILSGVLGLTIMSTMIIVIFLIRNYNMIEMHKESTDELRKEMKQVMKEIMEEQNKKG